MVSFVASGVPFNPPDIEEFTALAIKHNGNVRAIAAHLNLTPITLYSYFKRDPKAKEIIDYVRGYNTVTDLDLAEHVNRYNMMNYKENPSLGQRASEFTLMSKGKERGFVRQQTEDYVSPKEENIELKQQLYKALHRIEEFEKKEEMNDSKSQTSQELQRSDT